MCNLYSVMSTRAEIARLVDAAFDYNGNAPPMAGVHPDYAAPVVLKETDGRRVMRDLRWGMPSSSQALFMAADKRAKALRANHWNRQKTAEQLGINRTTLYKKMRSLGIDPGESEAA